MMWASLAIAILFEVGGTLSLRLAIDNKSWFGAAFVTYLVSFSALALALSGGMALGVAYGIWAAAGIAITAIAGKFLFKEPFTWMMGMGIVFIAGGVLLIELGALH